MRLLFTIVFVTVFVACQKENAPQLPPVLRTVFFKENAEAYRKVQSVLDQRSPGEKLERIESIDYIDSKNKSYAFVFYKSNRGTGKVILQQQYQNGQALTQSSITCSGTSCNCQVSTIISDSGDVSVSCSCSSCTMLVNTLSAPAAN